MTGSAVQDPYTFLVTVVHILVLLSLLFRISYGMHRSVSNTYIVPNGCRMDKLVGLDRVGEQGE